ncbi:unnamed protein product [Caretta caretta]
MTTRYLIPNLPLEESEFLVNVKCGLRLQDNRHQVQLNLLLRVNARVVNLCAPLGWSQTRKHHEPNPELPVTITRRVCFLSSKTASGTGRWCGVRLGDLQAQDFYPNDQPVCREEDQCLHLTSRLNVQHNMQR